ncbi:deleted in malignant brain tumors 1 protein-like [Acanthaster planci]|uniref:Deleted in malignant brain tumors 1 protein-like n=1 Tax=Acanthaster planci TaxID=133434 RepID=A0A8B7ZR48_ACAPL|nr:deleted in malignant brain tumors 1 protein-like [Acanthaster planci]
MHFMFLVTTLVMTVAVNESSAFKTSADNTLRLLGGATRCSGQVQVYLGEWLNVYRTHWGVAEGRVVCRQLGCGELVSPYANYKDKAQADPVWNELVSCAGDEATLMNCSHSRNASDMLGPEMYRAAVACHQDDITSAPESMSLRLVHGTAPHSGRVEVYYNGEWGTICGMSGWSMTDGHVICRQLGYTRAVAVKRYSDPFGPGNGTILMSFVDCDGHEEKLGNCRHQGWYQHNCDHYNDAGVICKASSNETGIRLADGTTQYEGRVELFYNGEWGTICDDGWGIEDARVVCRQLGFGPAITVGSGYGQGQGAILQSDVGCRGMETSILDCDLQKWYPSTHCHHREDAGVQCHEPENPSVRVRLASRLLESEGRVEVYHNGEWGSVCGYSFTLREADVFCRQLDYRKALKVLEPGWYGDADLIILDNVQCNRSAKTLEDCQGLVWYPKHSDCSLHETAGVMCDSNMIPDTVSSVEVRLTGGSMEKEGQVELYHNGQWGTVCASGFDLKAAQVVCRQLGYYNALYRTSGETFSDGSRPLLLDRVDCRTGLEKNLARCGPLEWYRHDWQNCGPEETAAVACHGSKIGGDIEIVVRLSNGTQASNGRVEVYHRGSWGSVCGAGLGRSEAQVVCRQLGYEGGEPVEQFGFYGSGKEPVSMWGLECTGEEELVEQCRSIQWYNAQKHVCDRELTAGVTCLLRGGRNILTSFSDRSCYSVECTHILA